MMVRLRPTRTMFARDVRVQAFERGLFMSWGLGFGRAILHELVRDTIEFAQLVRTPIRLDWLFRPIARC